MKCKSCGDAGTCKACMAKGGGVPSKTGTEHQLRRDDEARKKGTPSMTRDERVRYEHAAMDEKRAARRKAEGFADGGEVDGGEVDGPEAGDEADIDAELMDMCAGELLEALEKKDKKGVLESIRAIVLNSKE